MIILSPWVIFPCNVLGSDIVQVAPKGCPKGGCGWSCCSFFVFIGFLVLFSGFGGFAW
jgi:hypothetical protein